MAYATVTDIQNRIAGEMTEEQQGICESLLDDAAVVIDAYNSDASSDAKKVVSCRMVIRALGNLDAGTMPIGASQGSMSALGYSQQWTISGGTVGELYLAKLDKKLLRTGDHIGSGSPVLDLVGGTQ